MAFSDLIPTNIALGATSVTPSGSLSVNWAILNQGTAAANSTSTTEVRITSSSTSAAGTNLAGVSTSALAAGATVQQNQATAISGVSISDSDAVSAGETITVVLGDTNGLRSVTGSGTISGSGTNSLSIIGTLSQVNADLATLTDQENTTSSDNIVIAAADGRGGSTPLKTIAVSVAGQTGNFWISEGPAPGINGQESVLPNDQINGGGSSRCPRLINM